MRIVWPFPHAFPFGPLDEPPVFFYRAPGRRSFFLFFSISLRALLSFPPLRLGPVFSIEGKSLYLFFYAGGFSVLFKG